MSTLVTGTAGFIGSHVAQVLLARGDEVVGLDNLNDYYDVTLKQARLARLTDKPGYTHVTADLADRVAIGLLVDAGDHVGLAGAIERLYRDPELRRTLGVRAAGKARECFDERRVIRETLAVYERLLSRDIGAR